ncbi:MAG: YihY/virulence factor BrkB family protein [Steroidobacteraceae bacterium]
MRALPQLAWQLARATVVGFFDDGAMRKAAALSYYTLFSLAPLLIISIAIAGAVFGAEAARGEIIAQVHGLVGKDAATAIEGMLQNASEPSATAWAAIIGLSTLAFGATTAFAELKQSLDDIWEFPSEKASGLWYTLRTRLLSFGVIVSIGFLLLVSLVFSAAVSALQRMWLLTETAGVLLQVTNFVFSFVLVAAMFAMLYKLLPSVKIAWYDVIIGSIVTALLFTIGKFFIGLYLGNSAVTSSYGAAGAIILILLWVYYSSVIFLIGAEFTKAFARRHGSHAPSQPGPSPGAEMS